MKIMNISSLLRPLPKLLALLLALACALPLIHAKVGEQENWYLEKEIKFDNHQGDGTPSIVHLKSSKGDSYITVAPEELKLLNPDGSLESLEILDGSTSFIPFSNENFIFTYNKNHQNGYWFKPNLRYGRLVEGVPISYKITDYGLYDSSAYSNKDLFPTPDFFIPGVRGSFSLRYTNGDKIPGYVIPKKQVTIMEAFA